jgi:hypothetical protein
VFKPRIINSVHTPSDSLHRRGVTSIGDKEDADCSTMELTPMTLDRSSRATRSSSGETLKHYHSRLGANQK